MAKNRFALFFSFGTLLNDSKFDKFGFFSKSAVYDTPRNGDSAAYDTLGLGNGDSAVYLTLWSCTMKIKIT